MKIGDLQLNGYCALAPMAGVTDRAFRELCIAQGASFCVAEMVSAKGIVMGDRKSAELMRINENERPCGIQLFGSDPQIMADAAEKAMLYQPDFIDINMGCPAPKVVKNGSGSALLRSPELAEKIVNAVKKVIPVPVSVKFRIGWDENHKNHVLFAKALESGGADFITVHGRTRAQMYAPPTDLNAIAQVKAAVSIPVIGNGDIFTPADAKHMYDYTGCDFVMAGRGTMGNPWLFSQINAFLFDGTEPSSPTVEDKMRLMLLHAKKICEYKGERIGICEARKHALWYVKGIRGAAQLRNRFSRLQDLGELEALAQAVLDANTENGLL